MKTRPILTPEKPKDTSCIFDTTEPLLRLRDMGDDEFERVVGEWAYSCLKKSEKYSNVALMGGSGDSGRDLVACIDSDMNKFDIYQCRQYDKPLSPAAYMVEFGKLCYYTFKGEYNVPQKYYIIASNGIGKSLRSLIENPSEINTKLIEEWDDKCGKKRQIISEGIKGEALNDIYLELFELIGRDGMLKLFKYFRGDKIDCPMRLYRPEFVADLAKQTADRRERAKIARAAGYTVKFIETMLRKRRDEDEVE